MDDLDDRIDELYDAYEAGLLSDEELECELRCNDLQRAK